MTDFRLDFNSNLVSITSPCVALTRRKQQISRSASRDSDACVAVMAITNSLNEIELHLSSRLNALRSEVVELAIQAANAVLSDDDLVAKRVEQFVEIAFKNMHPVVPEAVFVHPSCVELVENWLVGSDEQRILVNADTSIMPGDCRVEAGTAGVMAELDALFDVVRNSLSAKRGGQ